MSTIAEREESITRLKSDWAHDTAHKNEEIYQLQHQETLLESKLGNVNDEMSCGHNVLLKFGSHLLQNDR